MESVQRSCFSVTPADVLLVDVFRKGVIHRCCFDPAADYAVFKMCHVAARTLLEHHDEEFPKPEQWNFVGEAGNIFRKELLGAFRRHDKAPWVNTLGSSKCFPSFLPSNGCFHMGLSAGLGRWPKLHPKMRLRAHIVPLGSVVLHRDEFFVPIDQENNFVLTDGKKNFFQVRTVTGESWFLVPMRQSLETVTAKDWVKLGASLSELHSKARKVARGSLEGIVLPRWVSCVTPHASPCVEGATLRAGRNRGAIVSSSALELDSCLDGSVEKPIDVLRALFVSDLEYKTVVALSLQRPVQVGFRLPSSAASVRAQLKAAGDV